MYAVILQSLLQFNVRVSLCKQARCSLRLRSVLQSSSVDVSSFTGLPIEILRRRHMQTVSPDTLRRHSFVCSCGEPPACAAILVWHAIAVAGYMQKEF
jgi:hypothetical protein